MPRDFQGHKALYLKGLSYGKYESRGLRCVSTFNICQAFLKSDNLLHKRGFGPFPMASTVYGTSIQPRFSLISVRMNQIIIHQNHPVRLYRYEIESQKIRPVTAVAEAST